MRPYLVRYASLQLRNPDAAEDVVQETLLAALAAQASFEGRANLRTWVTGILKHKIIDTIRRESRERPLETLALVVRATRRRSGRFSRGRTAWAAESTPWAVLGDEAVNATRLMNRTASAASR